MDRGAPRYDTGEEPIMLRRSLRRSALPLAIVLTVAACGGDDDTATTQTVITADSTAPDGGVTSTDTAVPGEDGDDGGEPAAADPCALLTTEDLATVTGVEFAEGVFNEDLSVNTQAICDWVSDSPFATAQVLIIPDATLFAGNRSSAEEFLGGVTDIDVPGAEAAYVVEGGNVVGMAVGDNFLQVAFVPSGPEDVTTQTTRLAEVAAGNLG